LARVVAENQALRAAYDYDFQGRSLAELSTLARSELIAAACRYTSTYRDVDLAGRSDRLFFAGHQPQLFHPGVWIKNFALSKLAAVHGVTPVNLVIDSDAPKSAALPVPTGSLADPHVVNVPFDRRSAGVPFEERRIADRGMFESFGRRAAEPLRPIIANPLLDDFWPRVLTRAATTDNLGACFAQARHQLEGDWGSSTLELPQSVVCQSEAFAWFAVHLLARLPRLWDIYNDAVAEYRRVYRIRSANHPVPNLAAHDDWLEAPFWVWTDEAPQRRRLFARQRGDELQLSNRGDVELSLPLATDDDISRTVEVFMALGQRGIRIRTRALTTTMFARLVAGDLFIHGIGGGKYDELTDVIAERFFGLELPRFAVLSGTLYLPVARPSAGPDDLRRVDERLRQTRFHPERFAEGDARAIATWTAEKQRWIAEPVTTETARTRCHAIRRVNDELQPFVARRRESLLAERATLEHDWQARRVLARRDYSFCFYPELVLRDFFVDFLAPVS
jgi:hypothetical protein